MKLVIDANILFSALIKDSFTVDIIVCDDIELFAPEFLFDEFLQHKEDILRKARKTTEELHRLLNSIKELIKIISEDNVDDVMDEAERISPDPKDIPYIALALKLEIPIWSNDKELKEQNKVTVYSTEEIIKKLRK